MGTNSNTLVKLKNAGYQQNDKWLVKGVSLEVEKGKIVTLIGPNGSGKSTTAKIALGIYKKFDGEVEKYTNKIGYVPQKVSIDWTLPLRVRDFMVLTESLKEEAIDEALSLTGVIHLKHKNLGNLSGGEFQRVLLARAISKKPDLLVLDEPVQGVDFTGEIALGIYKKIDGEVEKYTNKVGYVPQKISIDWTLPLRVNDFMLLTESIKDEAVNEALSLTGVVHLKNKNLGNLSGGEFQRVLLARAISKKPDLLVLDEPVQGVDFTGEIALYELIKKISDTLNCGILLISHDLHTVMSATDHVVCLNGHVCCSGTPSDVARNNEYKALFGEQASQTLTHYEHKHDHVHSNDGELKKN